MSANNETAIAASLAQAKAVHDKLLGDVEKLSDDICTMPDGTKAASAGAALRTQIQSLEEFKDGFHNLNLFGEAELYEEGYYINYYQGHISHSTGVDFNIYILKVDGSKTYAFSSPVRFALPLASDKYTATNDSLLENLTQINLQNYPDTEYIGFSFNKNTYPISDFAVSEGNMAQRGFYPPDWLLAAQSAYLDEHVTGGDVGTELRDIRIGYDNTEYETAGDAVRQQFVNMDAEKISKPEGGISGQALVLDDEGNIVWGSVVEDSDTKKMTVILQQGESVKLPNGMEEQSPAVTWHTVTDGIEFYNMATGTVPTVYKDAGYKNVASDVIGNRLYADGYNEASRYTNIVIAMHVKIEGTVKLNTSMVAYDEAGNKISGDITESCWLYGANFYTATASNTMPRFRIVELSGTVTIDYAYGTSYTWLAQEHPDKLVYEDGLATGDFLSVFLEYYAQLPIVPSSEYFTYTAGQPYASAKVDDLEYTQDSSTITVKGGSAVTAVIGGLEFKVTVPANSEITVQEQLPWTGYKWAVIGDSYTDPTINAPVKYHQIIKNLTGINTQILGQGGTGWWNGYDTQISYRFKAEQVAADTDVVTLFGSINDWKYYQKNLTIGDPSDTLENGDNTLCAYINDVFDALEQTIPTAQVIVFSPMYYHGLVDRLQELFDALKSCTEKRGYEFVDMLHIGWRRIQNNSEYAQAYCTDYSETSEKFGHPNHEAHRKFIAPKFYAKLKEYLPISNTSTVDSE